MNHPGAEPVEALARVPEAEALGNHFFLPQAVDRVANGPRGQIGSMDDLLLRQVAAVLEHFEDQLRRRREMFDLRRYDWFRTGAGKGKNDPSWYVSPLPYIINNS